MYHSHIHEYAKCTCDVHIYIHRTQESRNTKNTYDFSVQIRNFLLPLSLTVFRHKEREAQSFYSGFFICPPPSRATPVQGLREQPKVNPSRTVSSLSSLNSLQISQNPPRASGAWRHPHSVTSFPTSRYCDISEWHVRSAHAREHLR